MLITVFSAAVSGWLNTHLEWPVGYTRKVFHLLIFTSAAIIQTRVRLPGVILFGIVVTLCIIGTCIFGRQWPFYRSLARPKDAPHQTFFILIPMAATALGGLVSNLLFGMTAVYGYLVTGWGDAVAEPVGTRWGRHVYRVPSLLNVRAGRSLEGSAAVFLTGFAACNAIGLLTGLTVPHTLALAVVCGLTGSVTEAVSTHGLDNLTIQITVSAAAHIMIGQGSGS
ncbi:hypothetical protein JW948_05295 [bacterium]|nr:hypothetical protein [bacterium]